jgi:hypothetical protein
MEPAQTALEKVYSLGRQEGIALATTIIQQTLLRRLHADYAMDRVIRATLVEVEKSLSEFHALHQKEAQCPPSPSTNPTTSPNF